MVWVPRVARSFWIIADPQYPSGCYCLHPQSSVKLYTSRLFVHQILSKHEPILASPQSEEYAYEAAAARLRRR